MPVPTDPMTTEPVTTDPVTLLHRALDQTGAIIAGIRDDLRSAVATTRTKRSVQR